MTAAGGQRLDWRVVLVHTVTFRQARGVVSGAAPLAIVLGLGGLDRNRVIGIAVLATAASLALSTLRWWRFRYDLDDERLVVSQGLLSRSVRTVPRDRIRGVDVEAPLLYRLAGLAVVRIDAAAGGTGGDEAELDAVSLGWARTLQRDLLQRVAGDAPAVAPQPAPVRDEVYARLDPRWLLYAPLVGSYLVVPLAVANTVVTQLRDLPLPASLRVRLPPPTGVGAREVLALVAVVAAVSVLGALLAGLLANWGFVLRRRGSTLVAERGLLTRRTVTLERDRIRGHVVSAGFGIRLVRAARLTALVTGLGDQARRGQLLPLGPRRVVLDVVDRALQPMRAPLRAHPPAARRRRLVRSTALPVLVLAVAVPAGGSPPVLAGLAVLVVAGVGLGLDRYRGLGHGADARMLAVRAGSLVRQEVVLEHRAVLGWRLRQSWFQRRAGLVTATVCVGAGAGGYSITDCSVAQARALVAAVSPGWARPWTGPVEH